MGASEPDPDPEPVAKADGTDDGALVGSAAGTLVGLAAGILLGSVLGALDGPVLSMGLGDGLGIPLGSAVGKVTVIVILPTVFVTSGTADCSADAIEPPRSNVETAETSSALLVSALATTVYVVELRRDVCVVASNGVAYG